MCCLRAHGMNRRLGLLLFCLFVCLLRDSRVSSTRWDGEEGGGAETMSNRWIVRVKGGERAARRVAEIHGFRLVGPIETTKRMYEFELRETNGRTKRSTSDAELELRRDPKVATLWREPKLLRETRQRPLDEPLYRRGWKAHGIVAQCAAKSGAFMNVVSVWERNITGKGAVVTILDDGLEWTHPDIKPNYDYNASYDFNGEDEDPSPRYRPSNRHGTRCAGVVAAAFRKNSTCGGPGIAFNAGVGGVRMLDGVVTDAVESRALSYRRDYVDIYTVSWGPSDDGETFDEPKDMTRKALKDGVQKGRKGRGSIFVWAAGNGGHNEDSCAADGYINSIYTLAISAVDACGRAPPYTESCTSIQAVAFSSGVNGTGNITTTDLHTTCTSHHTGTSAAAPLAAGVVALGLEANPNLTWRDVQYITALTSKRTDSSHPSWHRNGAGYWVSSQYGFGLLDAYSFVTMAKRWTTVPEQHNCKVLGQLSAREFSQETPLVVKLNMDGCGRDKMIRYLEHVVVVVSLSHPSRGNVELTLVSPSGTESKLLPYRSRDKSTVGFVWWQFMTVHHWGENPNGIWSFIVRERSRKCRRRRTQFSPRVIPCQLESLSLRWYGTAEIPFDQKSVYGHESREMPTKFDEQARVSLGKGKPNLRVEVPTTKASPSQAAVAKSNDKLRNVTTASQPVDGPDEGQGQGRVSLKEETGEVGVVDDDKEKNQRNLPRFFFGDDFSSFFSIDEKPKENSNTAG